MLVQEWSVEWLRLRYVENLFGARETRESTGVKVRQHLRDWILPAIGEMKLADVRLLDAQRALSGDTSAATKNRILSSMSSMFADAERAGLVAANPCAGLRKMREVRDAKPVLSSDRWEELLLELETTESWGPVGLMLYTGARLDEILGLDASEVDRGTPCLRLSHGRTKEGKQKTISMPESALRFVPEAATGLVYGVSERSVRRHLAEASAAMGVRLSPHCLRHGWAAAADDAGASVRQIQAQLGHAKVETTERYLKLRPKGVEAIVDAVARAAV